MFAAFFGLGLASDCLCTFDVDRTLTGSQHPGSHCPEDEVMTGIWDSAYNAGTLHLSELGQKVNETFCDNCYLGIITAGDASGTNSKERAVFDRTLKGMKKGWAVGGWSRGCWSVHGPLVYFCEDGQKQHAVPGIISWYKNVHNVDIDPKRVWHFDDKSDNIIPFKGTPYNAKQVSCDSRDPSMPTIGFCGGKPCEVTNTPGVFPCENEPKPRAGGTCTAEGSNPYGSGIEIPCCPGTKKCLQKSADWGFKCTKCSEACEASRPWINSTCVTLE